MNQRLTEANISKTKPPILEVIKYLKELKGAWEGVEQKLSSNNADNNNTTKEDSNPAPQTNSTPADNKSYDKKFMKKDDKAVTSKLNKAKLPTHIELSADRYHMVRDSVILLEQLRTIDKSRLKEKICHLDGEIMGLIDKGLKISLELHT